MPKITLYLKDAEIHSEVSGILTSGMVGVEVNLVCDDSWDGLQKTLVCRAGEIAKTVFVEDDRAVVAHETMIAGKWLELGVEGVSEDGSVVIPTLWERCCIVMPGVDSEADPTVDPTMPIWAQLQRRVSALEIPPVPSDIGALPGPLAAKVGQHFQVAAVNQIGMVTAVEAVDMPSGGEYELPAATADTLGGVKAEPVTEDDTQPVRIGEDGMLYTAPGGGEKWETINEAEVEGVVMAELACNFDDYRKVAIIFNGFCTTPGSTKINAHFMYAETDKTKQMVQTIQAFVDTMRYGYILLDTELGEIRYPQALNWAQGGGNISLIPEAPATRYFEGAIGIRFLCIDSTGGGTTPSASNTMMGKIKLLGVRK